ncbi:MAG: MBL fold metallo-hydrolase, partial [Myxococcota bacterium]
MSIFRCVLIQYALAIALGMCAGLGCSVTSHETAPAQIGTSVGAAMFEKSLMTPGPVRVRRRVSARWEVSRAGLVNLDHPAAADLEDGLEPIEIYFYEVHHPDAGTFLVDSGIAEQFRTPEEGTFVSALVASAMNLDRLEVELTTAEWLKQNGAPAGVLLSHLHLDHIMGLPDVPPGVPLFVSPGETETSGWTHLLTQGSTDRSLAGHPPLRELSFGTERILDLFGDGSFFVLHVPGHTAGSLAFVARTPDGPVLITADTCHTRFGWEHGVESGDFTEDQAAHRVQLARLRELAGRFPAM